MEMGYTAHYHYVLASNSDGEDEFDIDKVMYMHPVEPGKPVTKVVVSQTKGSNHGFDSVELSLEIDGEVWMQPVGYMPPSYIEKFLALSIDAQKHMIGDLLNGPSCDLFNYHD